MNSVEAVFSSDEIIRIFIFLLYVPVCVISFWQLIPRLSRGSARLACLMLLAQLLVVALSLEIHAASQFDKWLWDFHEEWNIPATLASTQLGMVGGVALATAWLARASPAIVRFYLAGTGGCLSSWAWTNTSPCTSLSRLGNFITLRWERRWSPLPWLWLGARQGLSGFGIAASFLAWL